MRLSEHFTLSEFTKSQTANRSGLTNEPSNESRANLAALCHGVLEPIRRYFKRPVRISSGYRSPQLNKAIGGSSHSQHCKGEAADIEVPGISNKGVATWIANNLSFDQLILEFYVEGEPSSGWVHVSYRNPEKNRKQVLQAVRKKGITRYLPLELESTRR